MINCVYITSDIAKQFIWTVVSTPNL